MDETINTNEEANKAKNITGSENPDVAFSGVQPINLPERPKTDVNTSFQPFIDSATQNIAEAQETRNQGINNIRDVMSAIGDTENRRVDEMEAQGVNRLQEDVTRFDNLINSKTQKYRNQLQNLENQNVASSYIAGQKNRLNIQATRELANLSIIRDSQAGRLNDAKAWVNQKIDAETAQLKSQLDFQQFVYQENKEILTAEQDKQFQLQVRQTENELAKETAKQQQIQNMSLTAAQYGASPEALDAISGAGSFEEALNVAGEFLGEPFRQQIEMQEFDKRMKQESLNLQKAEFAFKRQEAEIKRNMEMAAIEAQKQSANFNPDDEFELGTPENTVAWLQKSAQYDKNIDQAQRDQIQQSIRALSGVEALNDVLFGGKQPLDSGRIAGQWDQLRTAFSENASTKEINAIVQGLIPTVARGVFGEVGVLTDADIENYKKTLPTLKNTEDENMIISTIMLDVLSDGLGSTLQVAARSNQNVSNFRGLYMDTIDRIEQQKELIGTAEVNSLSNGDLISTATGNIFENSQAMQSNTQNAIDFINTHVQR